MFCSSTKQRSSHLTAVLFSHFLTFSNKTKFHFSSTIRNKYHNKIEQKEIINADKARNLTREAIQKDDTLLYPIMDKIRAAIQKKEFSCYISGCTPDYVIQKLLSLGYKTKFHKGCPSDPREQDIYEVSWQ